MEDRTHARAEVLRRLEEAAPGAPRAQAVEALAALVAEDVGARGPEVRERVPALLADADPGVRMAAVTLAAAALPDAEVVPALAACLADADREVRLEAVGRLADLARPECRAALAGVLEDADPAVRFEAARGMAALKHPAGLEVLVSALEDRALRFRALGALGQLGDARALEPVRRLFQRWFLPYFDRTQAAGVLASLGDAEGGAFLLKRVKGRWTMDRAMAAELLGETRVPGARERLLEMVADRKEPTRGAAARGLGRLGDAAALGPLVALLEEPGLREDVRLDAAEGLCYLRRPEGHARVRAALPGFTSPEDRAELEALLEALPARMEADA